MTHAFDAFKDRSRMASALRRYVNNVNFDPREPFTGTSEELLDDDYPDYCLTCKQNLSCCDCEQPNNGSLTSYKEINEMKASDFQTQEEFKKKFGA